ncbi:hypothetical protein [Microbacterium sp. SLBN-111]|uniref:hypothetical protein n=1 Tax=Microbacterium sp. SLBN-111 TaxID=3377733 RepID=UPI003C77CEF7
MTEETPGATGPHGLTRRTIVKGAAWSVPAVAVAIAAPTASASDTSTCPSLPVPGAWVTSTSGTGNSAFAGWNNTTRTEDGFTFIRDSDSSSTPYVYTISTFVDLEAGRSYLFRLDYVAGRGCTSATGPGATSVNTDLRFAVGTEAFGLRSTQSTGAYAVVTHLPPCATGFSTETETLQGILEPTQTGPVPVAIQFVAYPTLEGNNDDYYVIPSIVCL